MRALDPGFSPQANGFSSFRALLQAAKTEGLISYDAQTDGSDVLVELVAPGPTVLGFQKTSSELTRVKTDLWRGFLDWSPDAAYYYERDSARTVRLGGDSPAPNNDANMVRVNSVSREEQLIWMKEFAAVDPKGTTQGVLTSPHLDEQTIRAFSGALKDSAALAKRWKKFLRSKVLHKVQDWAEANEIPTDNIEISPVVKAPNSLIGEKGETVGSTGSDPELREHLLAILASMPLHELLKLPVPLEYSLRV